MREIHITSSGNNVTVLWETRTTTACAETGVKLYEGAEEPLALKGELTTTFHIIILQRK